MSKENADKFLADINNDASLKEKLLAGAASATAWIAEAASKGYEVTAEELRAAAEALVGKPVAEGDLIGTLRGLFEGELQDGDLDAVAGGAGPVAANAVRKVNVPALKGAVVGPGGNQSMFVREASPIFPKDGMPADANIKIKGR
ncbi:MAG: Nif11-like leader peptide family natural product precursor [Labilithrix sp.]|nr:Nif11-like leader peptide family natural product precursor [Labilithrix sp.]MCW5810487.1 Nif11-like leader peptide family natural product precursor [Labilithrix sp.]